MAWSSFAHLPTTEEEYYQILTQLSNGMHVFEVDNIIARVKNRVSVQHHYRNNLARMGFFSIRDKQIMLNYNVERLRNNFCYIRDIAYEVLEYNDADEIKQVRFAIEKLQSYDLNIITSFFVEKNPVLEQKNLIRWLRPLIFLIKISKFNVNVSKSIHPYVKYIQEAYFRNNKEYETPISLEEIDNELKKVDESLNIIKLLETILDDHIMRFKIELLMMPSWATKNKSYKIGEDKYTHIKIKANLLKEDEHEKKHNT